MTTQMMPSTTVTEASAPSMTAVAPPSHTGNRAGADTGCRADASVARRRDRPNAAAPRRPERGGQLVLIAVTAGVDAHYVGRLGPSALAGLWLRVPASDAGCSDGQLEHG